MSAKKNMHIPLRYDKIKTKNRREKIRYINKRDKMKEIKKNDSCLSEIEIVIKSRLFHIFFASIVVLEINKRFLLVYLFSSFIILYLTFFNDYSGPVEPVRTF